MPVLGSDHKLLEVRSLLARPHDGLSITHQERHKVIYRQGDVADAIYFIHDGSIKFTTVSENGKSAVVAILGAGEFFGQSVVIGKYRRDYSAMALTDCVTARIEVAALQRLLERADFAQFLLTDIAEKFQRAQEDLVDHIVSTSETRLARTLLRLADFHDPNNEPATLPPLSQETLAEMIGTTRGRVNEFLNRFRSDGRVEYHNTLRVYRSRLKAALPHR